MTYLLRSVHLQNWLCIQLIWYSLNICLGFVVDNYKDKWPHVESVYGHLKALSGMHMYIVYISMGNISIASKCCLTSHQIGTCDSKWISSLFLVLFTVFFRGFFSLASFSVHFCRMGADQSSQQLPAGAPGSTLRSQRDEDIPYTSYAISKPIDSSEYVW